MAELVKPIPRRIRSNIFLGKVKYEDIGIIVVGVFLTLLFATANLIPESTFANWAVAALVAAIALLLILRIDGESNYKTIYNFVKYIFSPRQFLNTQVKEIVPIENIANETIKKNGVVQKTNIGLVTFKDAGYAKIIEINSVPFFTLTDDARHKLIRAISQTVKNIDDKISMQIFKCDRPVRCKDYCLDVISDIMQLKECPWFSEEEKKIRQKILEGQYKRLVDIDKTINVSSVRFYLIIHSKSTKALNQTLEMVINDLSAEGLYNHILNAKECAIIYKYMICHSCNEKEVDKLGEKQLKYWVMPKTIEFKGASSVVDGKKYYTIGVNNYPQYATEGFTNRLFGMPGNVLLTMNYIESTKARKYIDMYYNEIRNSQKGKLSEQLNDAEEKEALRTIQRQIKNETETMTSTSLTYTFEVADTKDYNMICKKVRNLEFGITKNKFRQLNIYKSNIEGTQTKDLKYNLTSEDVGMMFPFTHVTLMERNGMYIGTIGRGTPVIVDLNKRNNFFHSSSIDIFGNTGGGKSFSTKTMLALMAAKRERVFVFDPSKEYDILAKNLHGQVIDLGAGEFKINPFHVFTSSTGEGYETALTVHLATLKMFYSIIFKDIKPEAMQKLNNLTFQLYDRFGMSADTYDFAKTKPEDYPTFSDLYQLCNEKIENNQDVYEVNLLKEIKLYLEDCVFGGFAKYWNGPSKIDIHSNFVVFDFSDLLHSGAIQIITAQMRLACTYVTGELQKNYNIMKDKGVYDVIQKEFSPIDVVFDETHNFINPAYPQIAEFLKNMIKQCRKCSGKLIVATQSPTDLLPDNSIKSLTEPLLYEAQYTFLYRFEDFKPVENAYPSINFTKLEREAVQFPPLGGAMFMQGPRKRDIIKIVASKEVRDLFEKNQ